MVNMIGAALTGGACAYLGFKKNMCMKKRVKNLEAVMSSLELLEGEISFAQNKLKKAFLNADSNGFFKIISEHIDEGAGEAVNMAAEEGTEKFCFDEGDAEAIKTLGQSIGKTDVNEQIKHIKYVRSLIENRLEDARNQYSRLGRVYGIGGLLCGLMIVIILV